METRRGRAGSIDHVSSPVFRSQIFSGASTATQAPPAPPTDAVQLERAYSMPAATEYHTGRLTYDDVIVKTTALLGLVIGGGALGWFVPALWMPGVIVGLVLGLVCGFKREPSPVLMSLYAVFEGMALGGISAFFESQTHGIVLQAVIATVAVFVAVLLLFKSGKVRATPKMTRFVLVAMLGYLIFSVVNMVLVWTGVLSDFGLRSMTVWGIPLGLVVSVLAVLLGAYSLLADFDAIKRGVEAGVDRKYAWTGAFGLVVSLVWLYLEFLRILYYLNER
jgi:uncharacterized YccA/Bax inhibitor family protein